MNQISTESVSTEMPVPGCRRRALRGPLTFQQLFLLDYFSLKNDEGPQGAWIFRLVGALDRELLVRSLSEVIRRHDCLRTRIVMSGGNLQQHVDEVVELDLEFVDLAYLDPNERQQRAQSFIDRFAARNFELAVGPLMDTALIRLSAEEHLLAWSISHVIADASTIRIVLHDIWSVYGDLREGGQPQFAGVPVRYLDYACWQHATHDDWQRQHERYWQDRMACSARVQWPLDKDVAGGQPADASVEVGFAMMPLVELRRVARNARTIPSMVMLSAYAAVVASWCGQSVFTVPVNFAGRHRPGHEHAAGYFAQFLYLRIEVIGDETFPELLGKVSGEFHQALLHQDFGRIAAQVPDMLLGSMFSWAPWKRSAIGVPAACISNRMGVTVQNTTFTRPTVPPREFRGIGMFCSEAEGDYSAALLYRTDAFSVATVQRFGAELQRFCADALANPDRHLGDNRTG